MGVILEPVKGQRESRMKGDDRIIEVLNEVLTAELTAINQYFIHAEMCEHWGYELLYQAIRSRSVAEMKHAEEMISRILYLEGTPNMSRYFEIRVGRDVPDMLAKDVALERDAIARYNRGIALATSAGDNGSRHLMEDALGQEEGHAISIEAHLTQIEQMGLENYLANQVRK